MLKSEKIAKLQQEHAEDLARGDAMIVDPKTEPTTGLDVVVTIVNLTQFLGICAWLVYVLGKSCDFYIGGIVFKTFSIIGLWLFVLIMGMSFFLRAEAAWQKAKKRGYVALNEQFGDQPYIAYVLTQEFKKRFFMKRLARLIYTFFAMLLLVWVFVSTGASDDVKNLSKLNQSFIKQCSAHALEP